MTEIALTVDSQLAVGNAELFKATADAGFTGIGLGLPVAAQTTPAELASFGLRCHELLAVSFVEDSEMTMRGAEQAAAGAAAIGAEWVLGFFAHQGSDALEQVRRVSEIFADAGIKLAIEFTGVGKPDRLNEARELAAAARPGTSGVLIDTWHVSFGDPRNWDDLQSVPLEEIAYVQFDDHGVLNEQNRVDDAMNHRLWPGHGSFELERFVDILGGRGWDGTVSVEVLNAEYRKLPIEEYCREAYRTTAAYWT